MDMNERFALYLNKKNISVKDAALIIGKSEMYVRKLMRSGESFGIEPVMAILNSMCDLSAEWLLRGKGDMILKEDNTPAPASVDHDELVALRAENRVLRELLNLRSSEKKMETT